jgi:3-hydroxyacyl-[acyl-carrier-protein] dehydratase
MSEHTAVISAKEILDILPHRFPFLLVDRIVELGGDRIVAIKNVSWNEPYFPGHFPGEPVMPGVLQVEAMAQAAAIMAARSGHFDVSRQLVFFAGIDKVRFRRPVVPGDQLRLEVVPLRKGKIWKLEGKGTVDGQRACEAELLATIVDRQP